MSLLGFSACGPGGNEDPVPPGASITINPQDIEWEISGSDPSCPDTSFNDHTFTIVVQDSNGVPLGDVDLIVRADLAANTSPFDVIRLYDDVNGNGVVDHPQELVSSNTGTAFFTKTDKFTGARTLLARVILSCEYQGNITVHAGSAFGSTNIAVTEETP
jgi:hypothetical protein